MNRYYPPRKSKGGGPVTGSTLQKISIPFPYGTREYYQAYHILYRKPKREAKKAEALSQKK